MAVGGWGESLEGSNFLGGCKELLLWSRRLFQEEPLTQEKTKPEVLELHKVISCVEKIPYFAQFHLSVHIS